MKRLTIDIPEPAHPDQNALRLAGHEDGRRNPRLAGRAFPLVVVPTDDTTRRPPRLVATLARQVNPARGVLHHDLVLNALHGFRPAIVTGPNACCASRVVWDPFDREPILGLPGVGRVALTAPRAGAFRVDDRRRRLSQASPVAFSR